MGAVDEEKKNMTEEELAAVVETAVAEATAEAADPANQQEWIRQTNLIYSGLMAVGLVMVQPFLTVAEMDISAYVCVFAFAVSTPLLAALLLVNRQEEFRRRTTPSRIVQLAKAVAQGCAFAGVVAAFWHISWIAGAVLLVSAVLGVAVQSAGYFKLDYDSNFRRRKEP